MHRIALFGEVLADVFPDQTILGGAPYNVTRHLHALQQQPLLISKVGNDALKQSLFKTLLSHGIDRSAIQIDAAYPTGQVKISIENNTHHFDICPDQAYDYIGLGPANTALNAAHPDLFYFGTLAQRGATSSASLNALLNNIACPTFLDINLRTPWYDQATISRALTHADIVKLTEEELAVITALLMPKTNTISMSVQQLIERFDLSTVYITRGDQGASVQSATGETYSVAGKPFGEAFVDAVGAGDAFSSICIIGALQGWSVEKTLNKANTFAADVCKISGATPRDNSFYQPHLACLNA